MSSTLINHTKIYDSARTIFSSEQLIITFAIQKDLQCLFVALKGFRTGRILFVEYKVTSQPGLGVGFHQLKYGDESGRQLYLNQIQKQAVFENL